MTTIDLPPQTPPAPVVLQFLQLVMPDQDDAQQPPLEQRAALICQKGQVVARIIDVPEGQDPGKLCALHSTVRLSKNVAWDEARTAVVAQVPGHIRMESGKLWVDPALELFADLLPAGGAIDFPGPVLVHKDVHDLVHLAAQGDVTIHGSVEAAVLKIGGRLTVNRGICGKEHGSVEAAGDIVTRFASNARIQSGGNVICGNEIANSHVQCAGEFKIEHGSILAGHIFAGAGITCHTAGSPAGVRTILELGIGAEALAAAHQNLLRVEADRQRAIDIRRVVEPLLRNHKALSAAQKEKATELLYQADEADQQMAAATPLLERRQADLQQILGGQIHVLHTLHPGVLIRFPGLQATLLTALRGPAKIALSLTGGQTRIVATTSHGSAALPSVPCDPAQAAIIQKLLAFKAAICKDK